MKPLFLNLTFNNNEILNQKLDVKIFSYLKTALNTEDYNTRRFILNNIFCEEYIHLNITELLCFFRNYKCESMDDIEDIEDLKKYLKNFLYSDYTDYQLNFESERYFFSYHSIDFIENNKILYKPRGIQKIADTFQYTIIFVYKQSFDSISKE